MAENPCAEFFGREDRSVKDLPEPNVCVQWEQRSASPEHSPGPVKDGEELRRRIIHPTHIDERDEPSPTCFNDMWTHGLSVDRVLYRTHEQSRTEAIQSVDTWNTENPDKPKRSLRGLAVVNVSDLRGLQVGDIRALAVFDTAMAINNSHADVCALGNLNKLARKDLRTSLWDFVRKGLGGR